MNEALAYAAGVDWTDRDAKISGYFTVKEALWLPRWRVLHIPSETEKQNILAMAAVMDRVRKLVGRPISVHCWTRPTSANCPDSPFHGQNYNAAVGSKAKHSGHIDGRAVDWSCTGKSCDVIRAQLAPVLADWGLRMEDLPGSGWIHLDIKPVPPGGVRFFKP